jgi:hypothetical protein
MSEPLPDGGFSPLVYDELRPLAAAKLAHEPAGRTHDATALVHEASLRLGGGASSERSGFLRDSAVAMQRILVDHARRKRAAKRGGCARKFTFQEQDRVIVADPDTLLDIDAALTRLSAEDLPPPKSLGSVSSPASRSRKPERSEGHAMQRKPTSTERMT